MGQGTNKDRARPCPSFLPTCQSKPCPGLGLLSLQLLPLEAGLGGKWEGRKAKHVPVR